MKSIAQVAERKEHRGESKERGAKGVVDSFIKTFQHSVIARSESDKAISLEFQGVRDCFAALAMTLF